MLAASAESPTVTRFAPSPTGLLHLGHAYAALFAASHAGAGRFLLRIEDIDPGRCRPDYAAAILADLAWLGLDWDGAVRVQSQHLAEYQAVLDRLRAQGLLYPCFCTRAEIAASAAAPHGPDDAPIYPGTCHALPPALVAEHLAAGVPHAWRLDMAEASRRAGRLTRWEADEVLPCTPEAFGDVVLARKDAPASYHLCVTHDDAAQGVTLVTRSVDLEAASSIHRLLQALLGWPEPRYRHHALLRGASGRRLSKRDGAATLRSLREQGASAAVVRRMTGLPFTGHGS